MKAEIEQIPLATNESIRSFHWDESVEEVFVHDDGEKYQKMSGAGAAWHCHIESEITFFERGFGKRFVGDSIDRFSDMDLVLIGPNLPHHWQSGGATSGICIQFNNNSSSSLGALPEMIDLHRLTQESLRGIRYMNKTRELIVEQMKVLHKQNSIQRLASLLTILNMMHQAPRSDYETLSENVLNPHLSDRNLMKIQEILDYVINNCEEMITLEIIAEKFHTSKASLCRHVRKYTGKSFNQLLNDIRLSQTKIRLLESNDSISEIAFECGFSNLSNFNLNFKNRFQMTPSEYRKKSKRGHSGMALS